jgi:hypothetical protein
MSTGITIDQTDKGWHVVVTDAEKVTVDTADGKVSVEAEPEEEGGNKPLAVSLS